MAMPETPPRPFTFLPPLWMEETSSTNDVIKQRLSGGETPASGFVIAALRQTRGKGRMGTMWQSSMGGDLTFSFFWRGNQPPAVAATLPMACALGVRDFLALPPRRIATQCKWPNDVLAGCAKICGILAEGGPTADGGMGLIVGIGVNLRRVPGRDEALGRATATVEDFIPVMGNDAAPALLPELLACLSHRLSQWESGGFAAIRGDLVSCLWGIGRGIAAKTTKGKIRGIVSGLGESGELLLTGDDGEPMRIASVSALEGWEA